MTAQWRIRGGSVVSTDVRVETCLQRTLDEEVFGRAYGLAIPASLGGILVGSLIGPALSGAVGTSGALVITGCAVMCYAAVVLRKGGSVPAAALRHVPAAVASEWHGPLTLVPVAAGRPRPQDRWPVEPGHHQVLAAPTGRPAHLRTWPATIRLMNCGS